MYGPLVRNLGLQGVPPVRQLIPVCNRNHLPYNGYSSGSNQATCYRVKRWFLSGQAVSGLRLVFSNTTITASGEAVPADTYTLGKVTVEMSDGVLHPVFFSGRRSVTVEPGAEVISDPVGVVMAAGSTYAYIRSYVSVDTLGKKWPVSHSMVLAEGEGYAVSDFADGAVPTLFSASAFGPSVVLGTPVRPTTAIAIIGSSSGQGQGDTAAAPRFDTGYLARAFSTTVPYFNLSRASGTISQFLTTNRYRLAALSQSGATHVLFQLGSNDLTSGASEATMRQRLASAWSILDGMGLKIIQSTYTTVATSTDSWATLTNQTVNASHPVRQAINDWIMTKPGPVYAALDVHSVVEEGTTGKWKVDGTAGKYTADGTHLSAFAHAAVAATINPYIAR